MNTAVLFSGGKDSTLAIYYAMQFSEVKCLIAIESENPESYMFHTPNIKWVKMQSEAIGIPIIIHKTKGEKELELDDLKDAIRSAMERYSIEGVVTGAVESIYQASRIQKITNDLGIECFNPLWQKDQAEILHEIVALDFEVIVGGVFAYGLEDFVGRKVDERFINDIIKIRDKYMISVSGEGGEWESFVLDAPFFKKKLSVKRKHIVKEKEGSRLFVIDELLIEEKKEKIRGFL